MTEEVRTRDFSRRHRQLDFTADGETHVVKPALTPDALQEVLALVRHPDLKTDMSVVLGIFDIIMTEPEAVKMRARTHKDAVNPIGFIQIVDVIEWLVEEYTQRPTRPSATSSSGSQTDTVDAGTSSTAGVPVEESILSS